MIESQKLFDKVIAGDFNEFFKDYYGDNENKLAMCNARFTEAFKTWASVYGRDRKPTIYSIPYSILLAGDGADVSIATDMDLIIVVDANNTNISRVRVSGHNGEDNIDLYQHGPYKEECNYTMGLIRGVQQGFLHKGYKHILSMDMFVSGDVLPSFGLDEPTNLAVAVAQIINDFSLEGKVSEKEISEIVQWALANYVVTDSYATDTYSSLRGKTVVGDFTNADAESITEITPNMCGCSLYTVDIGEAALEIPDEEVDARLDAFIDKFNKPIETLTEKEFYEKLAELDNVDQEAALFLMDYYTQENFGNIYAENATAGIGSPSVETSLDFEKDSVGGAAKWHCKGAFTYNLVLSCVSEEAKSAYEKAMEHVFGEECLEEFGLAKHPAQKIINI